MTINNIKLIVGLGNPEVEYFNSRHNIGYKIVDKLLKTYQYWPTINFFSFLVQGDIFIGYKQLVLLLKPRTGMNNSGESVAAAIKEFNLKPSNIIVIHDDISLPLGTIRIRESGSSGGHNGVKSIINELGTQEFNRVKIGIGYPTNNTILDYVLEDFTQFEQDKIEKVVEFSSDIITNVLRGVITQGDTFNI